MEPGKALEMLKVEDIEKYVESINNEKQDEDNKRKGPRAAGQAAGQAAGSTTAPAAGTEAVLTSRPAGEGSGAPTE